jgi:RNA polymerase sigma-70 factor (ECF subfamily)
MDTRQSGDGVGAAPAPEVGPTARRSAKELVAAAYETHRHELYAYVLSATRDPAAAEDLVQETFVRLTEEAFASRMPDNVPAWLRRVATNLLVSGARRRRVERRWLESAQPAAAVASAEALVLAREAARSVSAALATLPAADRTALLLAHDGWTGAEVAAALGCSEAATRTRLCRARMKLRGQLGPEL